MAVLDKQRDLIARLSIIEDPHERLGAITSRAKKGAQLTDSERTDDRLVRGCSSRIWLAAEVRDGACHFRLDADSSLVKGVASLLCEVYDGASPAEVVAIEPTILHALGIDRMLSPTRLEGMAAIRRTIREFAAAHAIE